MRWMVVVVVVVVWSRVERRWGWGLIYVMYKEL